ncbi:MAG TPA: hypothetical protein VFZ55_06300 [Nitrososphaera sp.]
MATTIGGEENDGESAVCMLNGRVKNKKMNFTPLSLTHIENSSQVSPFDLENRVESGLEFILGHLSGPQFPRSISVSTIGGAQKEVSCKDVAMLYYQGALWEDCRISAFYPGQTNPNLIFIDIDAKDFCSERALKTALTKILKNIKQKLNGHPTVYRSGRGFHIVQPINCPINLDNLEELSKLVRDKDVNKAFLQFASLYLSDNKRDSCNHTSLKSCLLRVPHTINSRCREQVSITQEWDKHKPDYRLLMGSFYSYLIAKREEEIKRYASNNIVSSINGVSQRTAWIEVLLQTPLDDNRKLVRDLIIIPYLVLRRGIADVNQIIRIVMAWADKCSELRSLEPSRREFEKRIQSRLYEVMRDRIPPMRLETLREKNPDLYKRLSIN